MSKQVPPKPKSSNRKRNIMIPFDDDRIITLSSLSDEVVKCHVAKTLAGVGSRRKGRQSCFRAIRAPNLSVMEQEIRELKKVVEALAVRSVMHHQSVQNAENIDLGNMTVLDAEMAHQLLDNPPNPTNTLIALLALR